MQAWSWVLTVVGITALYFAGSGRVLGWAIGFGAQALWLIYAITTHQWGFIFSAFAYGFVYGRNWLRWVRQRDNYRRWFQANREQEEDSK